MTIGMSKYFVILLDEYRGYSLVLFVGRKPGVAIAVREMVQDLENIFSIRVEKLANPNRYCVK